MKLIAQIVTGIIIAVMVIVAVVAMGHVAGQKERDEQEQAEFCKKVKAQGMSAEELARVGCKP